MEDKFLEEYSKAQGKEYYCYRDVLINEYDSSTGSVAGCGIDRLDRQSNWDEIHRAAAFYKDHEKALMQFPIGGRREAVCEYLKTGDIPSYLYPINESN